MKRMNNKKNLYKSIILLVILAIGIGYAYLTSNLSISGQTEVVTNTWNIHFENLNISTGSVTASTGASINASGDVISYTINLNRPKDYYEFTVDVKNDGTLPGKVSISTLSGVTTEASPIIDYSIKYTNGNPVNIGDILNAGAKKTLRVRVFYKDNISESDFPSSNLNLNLTYTLQFVQSEEDEFDTTALIEQLKEESSSCIYQYTGDITDEVGNTETVTAATSNVYFNKCADKRNIKFNNMCWQMIRTTQTGGIKMIYNGDVVDGKCESSRGDHKGIVESSYSYETINSSYLYGDSFTYNTSTNEFTLKDTTTATWSDSTYEDLIGKFTCKSNSNTCTTIYEINSYYSDTMAYLSYYTIADTHYSQMSKSSFNANYHSLSTIGYMFNKVYNYYSNTVSSEALYGNDVSYSNGVYTLLPAPGETNLSTEKNNTHHYTCNNTTGTCSKVRYYFSYFYIELDGGTTINDAINEMINNDNVNRYNSSIKGIIDAWYAQNLLEKTSLLEDTIYCNSRNPINLEESGWNQNGSTSVELYFKNHSTNTDLSCQKSIDQFSISNNKAKLKYPVGLLQAEEIYIINDNSLLSTGSTWWTISPDFYDDNNPLNRKINANGSINPFALVNEINGVRPVLSLAAGNVITEGDGSETSPWIVE